MHGNNFVRMKALIWSYEFEALIYEVSPYPSERLTYSYLIINSYWSVQKLLFPRFTHEPVSWFNCEIRISDVVEHLEEIKKRRRHKASKLRVVKNPVNSHYSDMLGTSKKMSLKAALCVIYCTEIGIKQILSFHCNHRCRYNKFILFHLIVNLCFGNHIIGKSCVYLRQLGRLAANLIPLVSTDAVAVHNHAQFVSMCAEGERVKCDFLLVSTCHLHVNCKRSELCSRESWNVEQKCHLINRLTCRLRRNDPSCQEEIYTTDFWSSEEGGGTLIRHQLSRLKR